MNLARISSDSGKIASCHAPLDHKLHTFTIHITQPSHTMHLLNLTE